MREMGIEFFPITFNSPPAAITAQIQKYLGLLEKKKLNKKYGFLFLMRDQQGTTLFSFYNIKIHHPHYKITKYHEMRGASLNVDITVNLKEALKNMLIDPHSHQRGNIVMIPKGMDRPI